MDHKTVPTKRGMWVLWGLTALVVVGVVLWAATLMRGH